MIKNSILSCLIALLMILTTGGATLALEIESSAFKNDQDIPKTFTGDGPDVSPPLAWKGAPEITKYFVLICDDPDAPAGTWVHWVVYDIPATEKGMKPSTPPVPVLPSGAKQGLNDFGKFGYGGPYPPPGLKHRYYFKLYALAKPLGLPPGMKKADVEKAMKGNVLTEAQLMGYYGR